MSYITDELNARKIPDVLTFKDGTKLTDKADWEKRRGEMLEIIASNMFGHIPPSYPIETEELKFNDKVLGKKIYYTKLMLKINTPKGQAQFPVYQFFPKDKTNVPTFIHIAFNPEDPWRSTPVELLIDRGYGLVMVYYKDITSDDNDFENGVAQFFDREDTSKISLWAWGMKHVMDYVQTLDVVDKKKIAMIGHSRLGKTSLWTAANDTRFTFVCSNNAGCSGDAITRGKVGETVEKIYNRFPYWFVSKYAEYANNEDKLPFDQNFLVAAVAPRKVCIGAAELDEWADPRSEYLTCVTASPAFEFLGGKGFICEDKRPEPFDIWQEGDISYHLQPYGHLLGNSDWEHYMDFIDKN